MKIDYEIEFISSSGVYKTPFTLIIIFQVFIGGLIIVMVNAWFLNSLYYLLTGDNFFPLLMRPEWYLWLLVPLNIYGNIFLFAFSVIGFSALIFRVLNKISPPKEGIFNRGSKD